MSALGVVPHMHAGLCWRAKTSSLSASMKITQHSRSQQQQALADITERLYTRKCSLVIACRSLPGSSVTSNDLTRLCMGTQTACCEVSILNCNPEQAADTVAGCVSLSQNQKGFLQGAGASFLISPGH